MDNQTNHELLEAIMAASATLQSIELLAEDVSKSSLKAIAEKYIDNPTDIWWWQSLRCSSSSIDCSEIDSLAILESKLGFERKIYLAVTDDEPAPWPILVGNAIELISLLGEVRYFEYFLFDSDLSWLIFETHHDQLIFTDEDMAQLLALE